jgi:AcrR family transcriptional regulator
MGIGVTSKPGRPRNDEAHRAILVAANAILEEAGIARFTIEAVAARAGVGKATIYRRWPSKGALAVAGFLAETVPKIRYPDTGSSLEDLARQIQSVASVYGGPAGRVLSAIIAEGQHDRFTMEAFVEGYARPRRDDARRILEAGIARGELRPGLDIEAAIDALYGPVYYRMLVPVGPLDAAWVEALVSNVLRGLAAG